MNFKQGVNVASDERRVLIVEPNLIGHRSIYLSRIAEHFSNNGEQVLIVTLANQTITHALQAVLDRNPQTIRLSLFDAEDPGVIRGGFVANAKRESAYWDLFQRIYQRAVSECVVSRVFVPYLDCCLYALGVRGAPFSETPFSGICMRPSFHFKDCGVIAPSPKSDLLKKVLFKRALLLPSLQKIFPIDELLVEYFKKSSPKLAEKLSYFPDPAEFVGNHTCGTARAALGISVAAKVVLVYGALDERKGIRRLLEAVRSLSESEQPVLLLAGKQVPSIQTLLQAPEASGLRRSGKLVELNRFVSNEDEQMCFAAADIVWVVYEGHYTMSGVLVKAAQQGKLMIGCAEGLIGYFLRRFNSGFLLSAADAASSVLHEALVLPEDDEVELRDYFTVQHSWSHALIGLTCSR